MAKRDSFSNKMDSISNIPEILKEKILTYLPLKEAGRTSVLSKSWRNTWTSVPDIIIHVDDKSNSEKKFLKTVEAVFRLHKGPIHKFDVQFPDCRPDPVKWIRCGSMDGQTQYSYQVNANNKIPSSFFSCHELRAVKLSRCSLKLPQWFEEFKSLTTIDLSCVAISRDDFKRLVWNCPRLENLSLFSLGGSIHLNVRGSNLRKFNICTSFSTIEIHAPNLLTLVLDSVALPIRGRISKNNFIRALGGVPQLETLRMNYCFLTYLSQSLPLPNPSVQFHQLSNISVELNLEDDVVAPMLLSLLKNSPNLEFLCIRVWYVNLNRFNPPINFWKNINAQNCVFRCLKLVRIQSLEFRTTDGTLSFLKTILGCAPNLEKVHLVKRNASDRIQCLEELDELRKKFKNVEIILE